MRVILFAAAAVSLIASACSPGTGQGGSPGVNANEVSCLNPVALQQIKDTLTPQIIQTLNDPYSMPEARRIQLALSDNAPGLMTLLIPGDAQPTFDQTVTTAENADHALCEGDVVIAHPVSFNLNQMQRGETVLASLTRDEPIVLSEASIDASAASAIEATLRHCLADEITCEFVRGDRASYALSPNAQYLSSLNARAHLTYAVDRTEQGQIVASILTTEWDQTSPNNVFAIDYDQVHTDGERRASTACFIRTTYNGRYEYADAQCP